MTAAELSRIDRTITIIASPELVWRALASPEELSAWFQVMIEGNIAQGADVWMTTTHPQYAGVRFRVWFAELVPPRRFVWQWHPGAVDQNVDYSRDLPTTVTFTLEPSWEAPRLTLSETGFERISPDRRQGLRREQPGLDQGSRLAAQNGASG